MMLHLSAGGTREFRWEFAPSWNKQPTETRLSLRFSNQEKADRPFALVPLHFGGSFNAAYNDQFAPMEIPIPADATRVALYSVISGHGAETNQCAEFCNHQHEWTVNGAIHVEDHPTVGQNTGCISELSNQMIPNQYGTWWFGRGGWCPGQPVAPWIEDVTADVEFGAMATVEYRGLLGSTSPPDGSGNINMTSYLVFYR
jgi:hypothetical protein